MQRRLPRLAINSWIFALGFTVISEISGYFIEISAGWHIAMHTVRLCSDLLAGVAFLFFTGRKLSATSDHDFKLLWNAVPFFALELIFGLEVFTPWPYVLCAAAGAVISVAVAVLRKRSSIIPVAQVILWFAIATFAVLGNYRASAYWGLGGVFAAAGLHLWYRLPRNTIGRVALVLSLFVWSASFFTHSYVFPHPKLRMMAENIWSIQKFIVSVSMLLILLESEARENEALAMRDQLTGLANRRLMELRLTSAISTGHTSILLLDLNGFKQINDTHGHLAGDELLQQIAERLTQCVTEEETLARLGGDEFLIISNRDILTLNGSVQEALSKPILLGRNLTIVVNASIGTAIFPLDAQGSSGAEAITNLLRVADNQLYARKQAHTVEEATVTNPRRLYRQGL
ncbi:GGDEF domain-containing protein [Granulicella tundricola]|uniref:GGDEF domain-containing protein n=1 Tax=Granulicella tundricola TaxID=940615 RepID=UPI0012FC4D88|nr:GGDEF domain-containing protein [Granulicella tundricola]